MSSTVDGSWGGSGMSYKYYFSDFEDQIFLNDCIFLLAWRVATAYITVTIHVPLKVTKDTSFSKQLQLLAPS